MENSRFKFRARWRADLEIVDDILERPISDLNADHLIIEQYTGLKDSKGVDIYEGDIVRINIINDDYPQYKFDGLYEVCLCFRGVSFRYIKLAWEDKDKNQYPIRTHITSEHIYSRWHNKKGCHYTEVSDGKEKYSSNIEIIGNIHENPELLK